MKLSILILTIDSRVRDNFLKLIECLNKQIGNSNEVEILALYDNKKRSVGEKRNNLISIANGEYLSFIDDDDWVSDSYISSIIKEIDKLEKPDCIVFDTDTEMVDFGIRQHAKFGIEFDYWRSTDRTQRRCKPSHLNVWKTEFAKKYKYQHISFGEDTEWCERVWRDIKKQSRIEKTLLYPVFERSKSETRTSPLRAKVLEKDMWRIGDAY